MLQCFKPLLNLGRCLSRPVIDRAPGTLEPAVALGHRHLDFVFFQSPFDGRDYLSSPPNGVSGTKLQHHLYVIRLQLFELPFTLLFDIWGLGPKGIFHASFAFTVRSGGTQQEVGGRLYLYLDG